ncbi:MAG: NAD-dependent protein deacylase [Candidatus Omnitrophota bacterium]
MLVKTSLIKKIEKIVDKLHNSKSILFITGAGISADSGLPTYRGIGGLYNGQLTEDGIPIETALAGETLYAKPETAWKYLLRIEQNCRDAKFNQAHKIIAEFENHFERVWVLTQNIDGFHSAAGSRNVIDIHGDFHNLVCMQCLTCTRVNNYNGFSLPPICPECGGVIRPEVVFFGEMLPREKVEKLADELNKGFDVYFSIGTTSVFPYISQPVMQASRSGKFTVEINPEITEISSLVEIKINQSAKEALENIWEQYKLRSRV